MPTGFCRSAPCYRAVKKSHLCFFLRCLFLLEQSEFPALNLLCYRHRCCIVGWSQKSAWRTSQEPWSCRQQARESPALPATPATTTATTPPACPAHLERTRTAPTVNLLTPILTGLTLVLIKFKSVFINLNIFIVSTASCSYKSWLAILINALEKHLRYKYI